MSAPKGITLSGLVAQSDLSRSTIRRLLIEADLKPFGVSINGERCAIPYFDEARALAIINPPNREIPDHLISMKMLTQKYNISRRKVRYILSKIENQGSMWENKFGQDKKVYPRSVVIPHLDSWRKQHEECKQSDTRFPPLALKMKKHTKTSKGCGECPFTGLACSLSATCALAADEGNENRFGQPLDPAAICYNYNSTRSTRPLCSKCKNHGTAKCEFICFRVQLKKSIRFNFADPRFRSPAKKVIYA